MKSFDKENILATCKEVLMQRITTAELAMKEAQEASNSEDKSSAGDKYETARAMGQLSRDMNARQLVQARKEMAELHKIDLQPASKIRPGSLVICDVSVYFIAIGLGVVSVSGADIIVVSPGSPIALQMIGKSTGEHFTFNQRNTLIKNII